MIVHPPPPASPSSGGAGFLLCDNGLRYLTVVNYLCEPTSQVRGEFARLVLTRESEDPMTTTAHTAKFQPGDEVLFQALPTHEPEEVEITTVFAVRGYGGKTVYDYGFRLLRSGTGGRAGEKQLRTR